MKSVVLCSLVGLRENALFFSGGWFADYVNFNVLMLGFKYIYTMFTIILRNSRRTLKVIISWLKRVVYIVKYTLTLSL